uniref:Uncharacterized protein n=1 Tax=Tanacetum cinerariifolium TaxID=118510 RepID=A0A699GHM8_TANCI|nr:hypothetical protein [Tanacetum cinerariifolium]
MQPGLGRRHAVRDGQREALQQQRCNHRHLGQRQVLAQAHARAGAQRHVRAARRVAGRLRKPFGMEGQRVGKPGGIVLHQLHRYHEHGAGRQLPAAQRDGGGRAPAQQHRRGRIQAHGFLQRAGHGLQCGQVGGGGRAALQHRCHLGACCRLRCRIAGHAPGPPRQCRGRGFVAGQERRHAFVVHGLARPRSGIVRVQDQQPAQDIVGPDRTVHGQPGVDLAADQPVQHLPGLALGALPRRPVGPACGPVKFGVAGHVHAVYGLFHPHGVDLDRAGKQKTQDDVHRQRRDGRLERPVTGGSRPLRQCRAGGVGHQRHVGLHALGRKSRIQGAAFGLPRGAFRRQYAVAVQFRHDRDAALPAHQGVMVGHQQLAHQLRVGHDDLVLGPDAQVHQVAIHAAPLGERAQQVVCHAPQQAPAGDAGRRSRRPGAWRLQHGAGYLRRRRLRGCERRVMAAMERAGSGGGSDGGWGGWRFHVSHFLPQATRRLEPKRHAVAAARWHYCRLVILASHEYSPSACLPRSAGARATRGQCRAGAVAAAGAAVAAGRAGGRDRPRHGAPAWSRSWRPAWRPVFGQRPAPHAFSGVGDGDPLLVSRHRGGTGHAARLAAVRRAGGHFRDAVRTRDELGAHCGTRLSGVFYGRCRAGIVRRRPGGNPEPVRAGCDRTGAAVCAAMGRLAGQPRPGCAGSAGASPGAALAGAAGSASGYAIAAAGGAALGRAPGVAGVWLAQPAQPAPRGAPYQIVQWPVAARVAGAHPHRRPVLCRARPPRSGAAARLGHAGAR